MKVHTLAADNIYTLKNNHNNTNISSTNSNNKFDAMTTTNNATMNNTSTAISPTILSNANVNANIINNNNNNNINNNNHQHQQNHNHSHSHNHSSSNNSSNSNSNLLQINTAASSCSSSSGSSATVQDYNALISPNALFAEQANAVINLFDNWNTCERTVVTYALIKRMRYQDLKFFQHTIDMHLTQPMLTGGVGGTPQSAASNLSTVLLDINANSASYLQTLLTAYQNTKLLLANELFDVVPPPPPSSASSSDKDSCYGSNYQVAQSAAVAAAAAVVASEERRHQIGKNKEDLILEFLNLLPLLKPGIEDAKQMYLALVPYAVEDVIKKHLSSELVQQLFSYLLIHPAINSEDIRSIYVWLRHLETQTQAALNEFMPPSNSFVNLSFGDNQNNATNMLSSASSNASSSSSSVASSTANSAASCSSAYTLNATSGTAAHNCGAAKATSTQRSADWQTIAPPNKQQLQQQQQLQQKTAALHDWSSIVAKPLLIPSVAGGGGGNKTVGSEAAGAGANGIAIGCNLNSRSNSIANQLCDNLNGITLNELASSQNSLGLSIGATLIDSHPAACSTSLVDGVVGGVGVAAAAPSLFGNNASSIISILNNNNNNCNTNLNTSEDHDTSFSKNGTEILDFEPNNTNLLNACDSCNNQNNNSNNNNSLTVPNQVQPPPMQYSHILMSNCDQVDINRWSLDSKLAALKTRRSNSLTTQTLSSTSSSNSSVITVNDNCSNSTENLAQFANKPRSFSLSIEPQHNALTNSGSDTRLDDFKRNYMKFQTRNVGMSSIGLWLKSLRLHKYIELFKNMTYEEMLQISEDFLQSVGVTKGASHKLALCIEKLKERPLQLMKMEQELLAGQLKLHAAVEELANLVLTPMKPVEAVNPNTGEENVALLFLKSVDLVCTMLQKDPYAGQNDDTISVLMWIMDRSIHNEAFVNQANQLKELKFKLSKHKIAVASKLHHGKNGSNGNLNKPRWAAKNRKDGKNGSNDRINHRKNSSDFLSFPLSCMQSQQPQPAFVGDYQQQYQQQPAQHPYKSGSYGGYNQPPQQSQMKVPQQQQQPQPKPAQQLQPQTHFRPLPQHQQQHRRSLNNLIVVSAGPQQAQKMIFKPGQGMTPANGTSSSSADNLQMDVAIKQQQQQRKASLNGLTLPSAITSFNESPILETQQQQKQQHQQQMQHHQQQQQAAAVSQQQQQNKKTMAAVVMENLAKFDQHFTLF